MIRMLGGLVGCQMEAERLAGGLEADLDRIGNQLQVSGVSPYFSRNGTTPSFRASGGSRSCRSLTASIFRSSPTPDWAGSHRRSGGGRAAGSAGDLRVVVREESEEDDDLPPRRLGRGGRGTRRACVRGEIDVHPAAGASLPDRGRSPAPRAAGQSPRSRGRCRARAGRGYRRITVVSRRSSVD